MTLDQKMNLFLNTISKRFHIDRTELERLKWYKPEALEYKQKTTYIKHTERSLHKSEHQTTTIQ